MFSEGMWSQYGTKPENQICIIVINDRKLVQSNVKVIHTNFFDEERWDNFLSAKIGITDDRRLTVIPLVNGSGASMKIGLNQGAQYVFSLDLDRTEIPSTQPLLFAIRDGNMNILVSQEVNESGLIYQQYTALQTGIHFVTITQPTVDTVGQAFYLDNYYVYAMPTSGQDFVSLYLPDVLAYNDYYPFGMLIPNRFDSIDDYRYGFNGKEKDDEVKGEGLQLDYGFRIYDPRLGKFLSRDPLSASFPWYTPYQFAGNKPINSIDLDGLEEYHFSLKIDTETGTSTLEYSHQEDIIDYVKGDFEWHGNSGSYTYDKVVNARQAVVIDVYDASYGQGRNANSLTYGEKVRQGQQLFGGITTMSQAGEGYAWAYNMDGYDNAAAFSGRDEISNAEKDALDFDTAMNLVSILPVSRVLKTFSNNIVRTKAYEYATKLIATTSRSKLPRAVSVAIDRSTGKVYTGVSKGIGAETTMTKEMENMLPTKSRVRTKQGKFIDPSNCAECDAINNALNDGAKASNLEIHTVKLNKTGGKVEVTDFAPCDNCKETTKTLKKVNGKSN